MSGASLGPNAIANILAGGSNAVTTAGTSAGNSLTLMFAMVALGIVLAIVAYLVFAPFKITRRWTGR